MRNKVLFLLFCSLLSSCLWFSSQPVYASPVDRQTTGRTAWQHVPLPPPTSTPTPDPKAPVTAMLNKPFTVRIGQWATLANTPEALGVQLYGLVGDSRCPAGVDCIVAGQVEFILIVRQGKTINQERFQLSTNPAKEGNKVAYAGYTIELMGVEPPAPAPDQTLKPSEYIAILVVRAASNSGPTPEPTASQTATPVPQVDEGAAEAVAFNQPFDLLVGETASIHEADFHLTLRSLTEDSGCLSARDCSTMLAEGTLVLAQGEEQELLSFSTSFSAEQAFRYEFAGYVIHLLHVEQTRHGDQVATFMIAPPTVSTELPAPERIDRCPAFSRFDAAAILQEDVQQKAIANLVFGPLAADAQEARGLCGYVSTGFTEPSPNAQTAYLATQVPADHAVAAMLLEGDNVLQLLHLAAIVSAAHPDAEPDELLQLQTQLAAGDYENVIRYLGDTAVQVPGFTVEPIHGIGDEAIWLWQELPDGHVALFVSRYGQTFSVVVARLGDAVEELTVLDYAVIIARRLGEAPAQ